MVIFTNCRTSDASAVNALDEVAAFLVANYNGVAPAGPILERPVLLPMRREGNAVVLKYLTLPGVRYGVESSSDLMDWIPKNGLTGENATSLQSEFVDDVSAPHRFFRIHAQLD